MDSVHTMNLQNKLQLIEYPGVVRNTDKMLKTLGGIVQLSEVFETEHQRLALKFHPDNVYAKPAFADRCSGTGILFKVIIRRPKDSKNVMKPIVTKSVEILGVVESSYQFKSMCDYQYLPLETCPVTQKTRCIYNDLVPTGMISPDWFSPENNKTLFLPPACFARLDTTNRLFRNITPSTASTEDGPSSELIGQTRLRLRNPAFYIPFSLTDPIPTGPPSSSTANEYLMLKFIKLEQLDQVKELFAKRPIMSRNFVLHETNLPLEKLKYILPMVSYYYTTGPWRVMWVRFGYDPRKDFESRYYQQLDYRARLYAGIQRRSHKEEKGYQIKHRAIGLNIRKNDAKFKESFSPFFECDQIPKGLHCIFQYCDIRVPRIQEMLDKIPTPLSGATCNEKSGWLPANFDDQCRDILMDIVRGLIRKNGTGEPMKDEPFESEDGEDDDDDHMDNDDQIMDESDEEMYNENE